MTDVTVLRRLAAGVAQPTPTTSTTALTTVTFSAPGTPDYAIADLSNSSPYGFVSADEGQTVLSVIANLQTRVAELEAELAKLGMMQ